MDIIEPNRGGPMRGARGLAEIESDLAKAEAAFTDADTRLRNAERDRSAALDTIDKHQSEFDEAVSQLRQRSIAGSCWQREGARSGDGAGKGSEQPLMLKSEDIAEDKAVSKLVTSRPKLSSVSEEFDRLKVLVHTTGKARE